MNKEQLKKILDLIFETKKEDDKIQKATYDYFETIAPDSYAPILDWKAYKLLEMIKILDPELEEWISYFVYEAEMFYEKWCEITFNDKEYIINNEKEAKEFILNLNEDEM